ncbi:hypothetical protein KW845_05365 [Bordetella sp. BOR01]|nr:hypothetical protein [Bordetella sp. BOR01]
MRDLLRADAQAARAARFPRQAVDWLAPQLPGGMVRLPGAPPGNRPDGEPGSIDRIDVMAIYGVGKALHADISVNGRVSRYRAGHAMPLLGSPLAGESYALLAIEAPCVRLRKAGERYTTCLLNAEPGHD